MNNPILINPSGWEDFPDIHVLFPLSQEGDKEYFFVHAVSRQEVGPWLVSWRCQLGVVLQENAINMLIFP